MMKIITKIAIDQTIEVSVYYFPTISKVKPQIFVYIYKSVAVINRPEEDRIFKHEK